MEVADEAPVLELQLNKTSHALKKLGWDSDRL